MPDISFLADANVRAQTYYIARTDARCWRCGSPARLLALAVPHGHETRDADTAADAGCGEPVPGEPAPNVWQSANANAFLFYVGRLPGGVQGRLKRLSRHFRLAHSAAASSSYWANHCGSCTTLLDDHDLHCEPDVAFMPSSEAAAANIQLLQIHQPFEAMADGYAIEPEFFRFMRKS